MVVFVGGSIVMVVFVGGSIEEPFCVVSCAALEFFMRALLMTIASNRLSCQINNCLSMKCW